VPRDRARRHKTRPQRGAFRSGRATWAADYLAADTGDTFNLYDTSALAHADLIKAIAAAGHPSDSRHPRTNWSRPRPPARHRAGRASSDIFGAGAVYDDFDADAHTFGLITTEALYRDVTGSTTYAAFATSTGLAVRRQRVERELLAASATRPGLHAAPGLQHRRRAGLGAVVNGPNDKGQFAVGLAACRTGWPVSGRRRRHVQAVHRHGSRYVDDVRSWQSSEPALDMTGSAILAGAWPSRSDSRK